MQPAETLESSYAPYARQKKVDVVYIVNLLHEF